MPPSSNRKKGNDAQITLGQGWRQFAFAQDDVQFLGVIRRGMEIGALAQDCSGNYFQINGDMRQTLNKSRVTALLKAARVMAPRVHAPRQTSAEQRAAVVVITKPRRKVIVRDE